MSYNRRSGMPDGCGVLALFLTTGNLATHNGGYTPQQDDREGYESCATLFNLGSYGNQFGHHNCIVLHDQYLVLPLGLYVTI